MNEGNEFKQEIDINKAIEKFKRFLKKSNETIRNTEIRKETLKKFYLTIKKDFKPLKNGLDNIYIGFNSIPRKAIKLARKVKNTDFKKDRTAIKILFFISGVIATLLSAAYDYKFAKNEKYQIIRNDIRHENNRILIELERQAAEEKKAQLEREAAEGAKALEQ